MCTSKLGLKSIVKVMIFYRNNLYGEQELDCALLPHTMFQSQCETCIVWFLLYVWCTSDLPKGFLIKYKLQEFFK